jgi:hydrogenase nickel incorporation protein HypA/HybF
MHEASLMRGLMRRIREVAEDEGATRVVGIEVWLGALSHMSAEHFAEHFAQASAGTLAEGAKLQVTVSEDVGHPNAQDILLVSVEVQS